MPSLRLSTMKRPTHAYCCRASPLHADAILPPDLESGRELTKGYLISTMTDFDAEARLRTMPLQEQLVFLGQRSIEKYGCYSCHDLSGFEGMKPIGTELTTQGSKNIHLFDFGFFGDSTHTHDYVNWDNRKEEVRHTVPSWIYNKVRSPRVYDDRRTKRTTTS